MSLQKNRPAIGIDLLDIKKAPKGEMMLTQCPSPAMLKSKNRMNKMSSRRTNQQLIQESHSQLMSFVDSLEGKVQNIVQTYETEFLDAYREHIKRVREEIEDIKKRSLNSANSQQVYLDKIDVLQKQIVIFRQDSLKLFEKVLKKDKEVTIFNAKIKQLEVEVKAKDKLIYSLAKKNRTCEVLIDQAKQRQNSEIQETSGQKQGRFYRSQNKHYGDLYTPFSRQPFQDRKDDRPFSTQIKPDNTRKASLKLQTNSKKVHSNKGQLTWIKERLEEKMGDSQVVPINNVLDIFCQQQIGQPQSKRGPIASRGNYINRMESRRGGNVLLEKGIRQKSKEMAETNELKEVFSNCVEQVKKQVARRRSNLSSLNFFKKNGPQSYLQFKKVDHLTLMEKLISDDRILKKLHQLMFA